MKREKLTVENLVRLEKEFGIDKRTITNIVDIDNTTLTKLEEHLNKHLFGNSKFKIRLLQELKRFRLFNKLGERKIFSAFVCGPSGIGKTLTAKLLHDCLAPEESYIKINLGNYSDHSALSSLIGSPRGYIGSSKGELSGKINESKSTIILIDEFETGIHKHALIQVAKWLAMATERYKVQLFLTTHSDDAIDALVKAQEDYNNINAYRLEHYRNRVFVKKFEGIDLYRLRREQGMDIL